MHKIKLNFHEYLELERLDDNSFLPVKNFMKKRDANNVINNMKYKDYIFPLPILLPIDLNKKKELNKNNQNISLFYKKVCVGEIKKPEVFEINLDKMCQKLFGTKNVKHPGVNFYKQKSGFFVGGETFLKKKIKHEFKKFEISPAKVKKIKIKKKLKTLVGFQTRNVPHKAHEFLIRNALENYDGVFIQPLIGKKKPGDYLPSVIMSAFNFLVNNYLIKRKIILGSLSTFMRYAGPREALFHAIIRRNYGCTHFIVGRDHAGVGNFYKKLDALKLVKKYENKIKIKIIDSTGPFYCEICKMISTNKICKHVGKSEKTEISGTYIRSLFKKGIEPNEKYINKKIILFVKKNFRKIFI
jgi:sulfate adenylyltransferase